MYAKFLKRFIDFWISLIALIILSPLLLILTIVGAVAMKGNPFFTQLRPGKKGKDGKEKIFRLIKFRTMSNKKDKDGNLLPDKDRLNKYGRILRATSLDELPELINIVKGDMAIVGPRPLAVKYLDYYTENERRRHDVLPGLTGLAQINGRNCINWPQRFAYDLEYVDNISFALDVKILFKTVLKVLKRSDVSVRATGTVIDFDKFRIMENEKKSETAQIATESDSQTVALRDVSIDDAELLMQLNNDAEIAGLVVGNPKQVTLQEQMQWMEKIKSETTTKRFIVEYNGESAGTIIVSDIDMTNMTANVNIKLKGDARGKGIGKQSIKLALEYCFEKLGAQCVTAHVLSFNAASLALFKSCGFTEDGDLRRQVIKNNEPCDLISFSITRRDYNQNQVDVKQ